MADAYRRSGRGGAGNFHSQKDLVDEASKPEPKVRSPCQSRVVPRNVTPASDLEAQKSQAQAQAQAQTPSADDAADVPTQTGPQVASTGESSGSNSGNSSSPSARPQAYTRSGRGGAGNMVDPAAIPQDPNPNPTATPSDATTQPQPARSGHSGRGGAGNWAAGGEAQTQEEGVYDAEQERKRREALDAHILQDIRDSLPQPPKIHYMHGPGRGRKPDLSPG
ncbi:hypothetical protein GGR54DRAFT_171130 [Hypoxylon sp. NC1633]|nr:hypothetical protein GGR54DRAFT_171130 [Hypoxylon sp. NC1633]